MRRAYAPLPRRVVAGTIDSLRTWVRYRGNNQDVKFSSITQLPGWYHDLAVAASNLKSEEVDIKI
jgi:hypothetical protein